MRKYLARVPPGLRGPRPAAASPGPGRASLLPRRRPRRRAAAVAAPAVFRRRRLRPYGGPERAQAARGRWWTSNSRNFARFAIARRAIASNLRPNCSRRSARCTRCRSARETIETSLAIARHRIDELEASTSWRMTAPVRAGGHRAKILLARTRAQWATIRRTPQLRGADVVDTSQRGSGGGVQAWAGQAPGKGALQGRSARRCSRSEASIAPLAFAVNDAPRVSIVIPVFGNPLLTFTCLKSVQAHYAARADRGPGDRRRVAGSPWRVS